MHDQPPSRPPIDVHDSRHIDPRAAAGARLHFEIEVRNRPPMRGAVAHLAVLGADERPQRASALQQVEAGPAEDLLAGEAEQRFGARIPGADLTTVEDGKGGVAGVVEEFEQFPVEHEALRRPPAATSMRPWHGALSTTG